MEGLVQWWRLRTLNSPNVNVRLRAIERLGTSGNPEATTLLIDALADPGLAVRGAAATALAEIGDPRAIRPLVELALHERESDPDNLVLNALAAFGPDQVTPLLIKALDDHDAAVRQLAAVILRKICWDSMSDAERARAVIVQGDWEAAVSFGVSAVKPLVTAFVRGTQRTKREAAEALGQIGTVEAFGVLLASMQDTELDDETRKMAAWALRSYCWKWVEDSHLAGIAIVLDDWDAVVKYGAAAVGPLKDALGDKATHVRARAAEALGKIGNDEAIDALAAALMDSAQDLRVRETSAMSLGQIADMRTAHLLVSALGDEGWHVRVAAAKALDKIDWLPTDGRQRALFCIAKKDWSGAAAAGADAVQPLVDALRYQAVNTDAARTLIQIGQPGVDALVAILKSGNLDAAIREVAATALAEARDPRAAGPLMSMLDESDMAVRLSAIWMLERLGWEPADDAQRALAAMAHGDWARVRSIGVPAIDSLLQLADASMASMQTVATLTHIVETAPGRISTPHLRRLAALEDLRLDVNKALGTEDGCRVGNSGIVDCAKVRELAKLELSRRELIL
jgi:HEAT repeat protein